MFRKVKDDTDKPSLHWLNLKNGKRYSILGSVNQYHGNLDEEYKMGGCHTR